MDLLDIVCEPPVVCRPHTENHRSKRWKLVDSGTKVSNMSLPTIDCTGLSSYLSLLTEFLGRKNVIAIIYLDFNKAFNEVPQKKLFTKWKKA